MRNKVLAVVVVAASIMLTGPSFAAHPLITDDTGTQGTGKFQIEATGAWDADQENPEGEGVREINSFATVAFTGGVSEAVDLVLAVPYVWSETKEGGKTRRDDGLLDTVIEVKWRFYAKQHISLAIKPGMLLPTGNEDEGLGTGHYGYTTFFLATIETAPWAFDANLGYLHLENRAHERVNIWFGSLASRYAMAEQWTIVGEIGAARNTDPADSSHTVFAQAGLVYSPNDDLDLSTGFISGLSESEVDQSIRVGVTIRF
jgi:hypothetical protein